MYLQCCLFEFAVHLRGIPSNKLISARVAFHDRDLRESQLSNHGNLSDQTNLWGILQTSLNIPQHSLENLDGQRHNSRESELNGTVTLPKDSFSRARFSALGSMCVYVKGAFIASLYLPLQTG